MADLDFNQLRSGSELLKRGLARMQQGGVIMDVVNPEQAAVAEDEAAVAELKIPSTSVFVVRSPLALGV